MNDGRGSWYLLTGLILGVVIGLLYAWVIGPVRYVNTSPALLQKDYKDKYRVLIAEAYLADGDLLRAKARLSLLGDGDTYSALADQAQRSFSAGGSQLEARALGMLLVALGKDSGQDLTLPPAGSTSSLLPTATRSPLPPTATATETLTPTQTLLPTQTATLTPTSTPVPASTETAQAPAASGTPAGPSGTPLPSFTPLPSPTPSPTPGAPFVLEEQEKICDLKLQEPLLQIVALDASKNPIPGVEVIVGWDGGEGHFYTGLKPDMGLGYADFSMTPDITYTLRLGDGGQPVGDLIAFECQSSGAARWGAWKLTFVQP